MKTKPTAISHSNAPLGKGKSREKLKVNRVQGVHFFGISVADRSYNPQQKNPFLGNSFGGAAAECGGDSLANTVGPATGAPLLRFTSGF
ncbi:unnamed protein product, partial [Vitis vinifera]